MKLLLFIKNLLGHNKAGTLKLFFIYFHVVVRFIALKLTKIAS